MRTKTLLRDAAEHLCLLARQADLLDPDALRQAVRAEARRLSRAADEHRASGSVMERWARAVASGVDPHAAARLVRAA